MVSDKLIQNSIKNFKETLECLSSQDEQVAYKKNVPFVHVPVELFAQWEDHIRMIKEVSWFGRLFSEREKEAVLVLDEEIKKFILKSGNSIPDISEILKNDDWNDICVHAESVIKKLELEK